MKHFKMVNGEKIEMTTTEYKVFEESRTPTLVHKKNKKIRVREEYLKETDWYALRSIDTGEYPDDIKNRRILARQEIEIIKACTTEDELNEITNNF